MAKFWQRSYGQEAMYVNSRPGKKPPHRNSPLFPQNKLGGRPHDEDGGDII